MLDLNTINKDTVSIIKDPFNKECIDSIFIAISTNHFTKEKYCWATVDFKNGKTEGKQKFGNHTDFKVLITELQAFMDSLQSQQKK